MQKTDENSVPLAITVFPAEVYRAPETWARTGAATSRPGKSRSFSPLSWAPPSDSFGNSNGRDIFFNCYAHFH